MPKILFVLNESYFFLSHRLPVARAVQQSGTEVHVAAPPEHVWAPPGFSTTELEDQGFVFHPIPLSRRGTNPVADLRTLVALLRLYRRLRPAMIHHLTIKPNVYGGIAARLAGVPKVVFSVTGLGQIFVGKGFAAAVQRVIVSTLLRISMAHPNCRVIFQNSADRDEFLARKIVRPSDARVILGSGVDIGRFKATGISETDTPVVVLCARLIWEKGVGEFVEAARTLRKEGVEARFALVGDTNPTNSRSVPRETLEAWVRENLVEWWGFRQDMDGVLAQSNIVCLPSTYGEGVPKILLEAAASARPIVTTDIAGCRDAIENGISGLLVPPGDTDSLADALRTLLADPEKRRKMGAAGRRLAEQKFDDRTTAAMTVQVYEELNS
jgi:glycosyltransferase involved in cell wall biosynthesis